MVDVSWYTYGVQSCTVHTREIYGNKYIGEWPSNKDITCGGAEVRVHQLGFDQPQYEYSVSHTRNSIIVYEIGPLLFAFASQQNGNLL